MKKQYAKTILAAILAIIIPAAALAAGSATWSTHYGTSFNVHRCAWVSDASRNVSAGTGVDSALITGTIVGVNFKFDHNAVPTNLYNAQMPNEGGENILLDALTGVNVGAGIPSAINSADQRRTPFDKDGNYKKLWNETVTPSISGAGSGKRGYIDIIVVP